MASLLCYSLDFFSLEYEKTILFFIYTVYFSSIYRGIGNTSIPIYMSNPRRTSSSTIVLQSTAASEKSIKQKKGKI